MSRSEYRERTAAWLVEPESLEDLCDFLADGGTLSEYTTSHGIKFRTVLDWLQSDPDRARQYAGCTLARTTKLEDAVLVNLRDAAAIDPRTAFDTNGNLLEVPDLPDTVARSLTDFSVTIDQKGEATKRIKFTPRHTANEALGKHLGMFRERVELTGKDGGPMETKHELTNETARRVAFLLQKAGKQPTEAKS